jgi:hypothetical protein
MTIDLHLHTAAPLLPALWAGVIVGVSFIAQAAKFSTPGLTRPIALAVGRQMFRATQRAECVLGAGALMLAWWGGKTPRMLVCAAVLILLAQIGLLMPPLSRRVDAAMAGEKLSPSAHHMVFAALELCKLLLLVSSALLLSALGGTLR